MTKMRLLYLENDPYRAERVRSFLAQENLHCNLEIHPDAAGFTAALGTGSYHAVLSSWQVTGLQGKASLQAARAASCHVPFIFVSERPGEQAVIEALTSGADDFVLLDDLHRLAPALRKVADGSFRKRRIADRALGRQGSPEKARRDELLPEIIEQLNRRLQELETLMELVPVAIWVSHDPYCHEITGNRMANDFYEAAEGENVSAAPSPGIPPPQRRFFLHGHELSAEELPMQYAAAHGVEVRNQEIDVLLTSGKAITMWGSASPLKDQDGKVRGCIGAFLDISERKAAEKELLAGKRRLRQVLESITDAYICVDRQCRLLDLNPVAERDVFSRPAKQLVGKGLWDIIPGGLGGEFHRRYEEAFTSQVPVHFEAQSNLTGKWLEVHAYPCEEKLDIYFRDISSRKQAEEELRRREELLDFITVHSPDTIFFQDSELRYSWVKPAPPLCPEDYLGKSEHEIYNHHDAEFLTAIKRQVIESGNAVTVDLPLVIKGKNSFFEATFEPWCDENGTVIGLAGYIHDITERKRADDNLRMSKVLLEQKVVERTQELARTINALQQEISVRQMAELALKREMMTRMQAMERLRENERLLIQQSRQAAMGEMISNIAHQWRQPLNTLGLLIQGLAINYELGEFNQAYLSASVERSMQLIQHMSQTIDDFRNFFKPNKEKVPFSLAENVSKTVGLLKDAFTERGITILTDLSGDSQVVGYPNELSQAFINILNNARDAFNERKVENPLVRITLSSENGSGTVTISDNAGGIPENAMDNLFLPYFTTKGHQGTGLGLFMSKTIVEKNMNGSLTARNIGDGAEFIIHCPMGG